MTAVRRTSRFMPRLQWSASPACHRVVPSPHSHQTQPFATLIGSNARVPRRPSCGTLARGCDVHGCDLRNGAHCPGDAFLASSGGPEVGRVQVGAELRREGCNRGARFGIVLETDDVEYPKTFEEQLLLVISEVHAHRSTCVFISLRLTPKLVSCGSTTSDPTAGDGP